MASAHNAASSKALANVNTRPKIAEVERLAKMGFRLFPCRTMEKQPMLKGWQTVATSDLGTLRRWALDYPHCNWAVACGSASGVWVLDVDGELGRTSLMKLEAEHGKLVTTAQVRTGRKDGGLHYWFRLLNGSSIPNSASKIGPGLDVRGDGGYVVVPPSTHPTGRAYHWSGGRQLIVPAPQWLENMAMGPKKLGAPAQKVSAREFQPVRQGFRNDTLTRRAGSLRRNGASQRQLEETLLSENRFYEPPLPEREVIRIAANVAKYAVGGPDPLERAWQAVAGKEKLTTREQFLQLCLQLQIMRPEFPIILPLERIAETMSVHFTTIQYHRKRAVAKGILLPISESYIPHVQAGEYWFRGLRRQWADDDEFDDFAPEEVWTEQLVDSCG